MKAEQPDKNPEKASRQDGPAKETGDPLEKKPKESPPEEPAGGEEPGTFDKVMEHGKQMGF